MDAAISFTTVCINTALYLPWLASQCLKAGVVIKRGVCSHVLDAIDKHHTGFHADLIVNCTGLSSKRLGGVEDQSMFPSRGQTVLVRNDPGYIVGSTGTDDGPDESVYIMNRAGGGGCILGGCSLRHNWESQPDPNMAVRIMKRAVDICPKLVPEGKGIEGLSIVRHNVGLRPMRANGIRIETEAITNGSKTVPVVHNYGHGGAGYQTSYGCAKRAVRLVEEALAPRGKL
jgi:D-amino-acid oxidase